MKEGARVREEEPVVRESSRTQWLRCCREAAWISGVGGEGTADAFRSWWWGGLGGMLTSGQPCKSRKPRRWPWSKVCLVNRGGFWQKMKWSNREAQTTSFRFFLSLFGSAPRCFTDSGPLHWRAASWQGSFGHRLAYTVLSTKVQSGKKKGVVQCAFCFQN